MLGAIFGAFAQAAHTVSKTVEEVGEHFGVPKWITGGISGAFSAVGHGLEAGKDMEVPGMGAIKNGFASIMGTSVGSSGLGEITHHVVKLGRSGDLHNAMAMNDPMHEYHNTIVVPDVPMKANGRGAGLAA